MIQDADIVPLAPLFSLLSLDVMVVVLGAIRRPLPSHRRLQWHHLQRSRYVLYSMCLIIKQPWRGASGRSQAAERDVQMLVVCVDHEGPEPETRLILSWPTAHANLWQFPNLERS